MFNTIDRSIKSFTWVFVETFFRDDYIGILKLSLFRRDKSDTYRFLARGMPAVCLYILFKISH